VTTPSTSSPLRSGRARVVTRWVLAFAMIAIGVGHFLGPEPFVAIVPAFLPAKLALVLVSGVFEVLGGVGLLVPRVRRLAGYGLVALYVAVFPANVNMAVNHLPLGNSVPPDWALWGRLPLQIVLIALALWVSRDDQPEPPLPPSPVPPPPA
jgi:uncharacterized membrane protein